MVLGDRVAERRRAAAVARRCCLISAGMMRAKEPPSPRTGAELVRRTGSVPTREPWLVDDVARIWEWAPERSTGNQLGRRIGRPRSELSDGEVRRLVEQIPTARGH